MKKYIILPLLAALICVFGADAQSRRSLRINEVMVQNESSIIDDYGQHHAWIELFNSNFAPLEISSVYITNDRNNPTKYPVPLGDVKTHIEKRQHVVFFADGEPAKGTFHLNFTLEPGVENWIGVYDADGKTLIDEVTIPASVATDQTWARSVDGKGEWTLHTGLDGDHITPSSANVIRDSNHKIEEFATRDSHGFAMTLMSMCIVFSALLCLCLCFYAIGQIGGAVSRFNKKRALGNQASDTDKVVEHDSGEEIAAIVMALHEHLNAHDRENTILTINKVKRAYSPWSSKIYSLRQVPQRR
jgi:Na+-transporting methylmalonyl-CoA/oxaloacetate decarboxylase gamma subunit